MPIRLGHAPKRETILGVGAAFPVVICDYCGQRIRHVWNGVFLTNGEELSDPADTTEIYFAHRDSSDETGNPVNRCHKALEEKLRREQGLTLGWIELSWFPVQLALNLSGGEQALVKAIPLVWRDHWLLKWVAAGMPDRPLPGQPKAWEFRLADLRKLADRLEASMPSHDYSRAVEDDIQFGTAFDPE